MQNILNKQCSAAAWGFDVATAWLDSAVRVVVCTRTLMKSALNINHKMKLKTVTHGPILSPLKTRFFIFQGSLRSFLTQLVKETNPGPLQQLRVK